MTGIVADSTWTLLAEGTDNRRVSLPQFLSLSVHLYPLFSFKEALHWYFTWRSVYPSWGVLLSLWKQLYNGWRELSKVWENEIMFCPPFWYHRVGKILWLFSPNLQHLQELLLQPKATSSSCILCWAIKCANMVDHWLFCNCQDVKL